MIVSEEERELGVSYLDPPEREVLADEGSEDEEAEMDDPEDSPELCRGGALPGGLQGVEGGLQGGTHTHRGLGEGGYTTAF